MRSFSRPSISVTAPTVVAALMLAVSVGISERVMNRLKTTQENHLSNLSEVYLDGLASALLPHVLREDPWETFDTLDRAGQLYGALKPIETVVIGRDGNVLAASNPRNAPSFEPLPARLEGSAEDRRVIIDEDAGRALLKRDLSYQGERIGALFVSADIRHLLDERRSVIVTLLATNAVLTIILVLFGYLLVRRMVGPMRLLTEHLGLAADGKPASIPDEKLRSLDAEARRMALAHNRLVAAEFERRALILRLAGEERAVGLGRLAAGMAHEINNPLGGLFNALATLRRHGDAREVRDTSLGLLERGLHGIRNIVAAALHTYRPERTERGFGRQDVEDVRILVSPEARRRGIRIGWNNPLPETTAAPSAPIRQALLNLALNACAATPDGGKMQVTAKLATNALELAVSDGGGGMPERERRMLEVPGAAPPVSGRDGLGTWIVRRLVDDAGGSISICDDEGSSCVCLRFPVTEQEARSDVA